jgi:N-methylhydantoinase B
MMQQFDPLTFQILWSRSINIADEMAAALVKTAFSHVVRDNHDFACGIYDETGDMLAQATLCTPGQIGAMPRFLKEVLQQYPPSELEPGDVLVTNDPWLGSGHTPDIFVATPAFKSGHLVGFAANSAHHIDIGGRMSSPEAREVYEEGLIVPITKLHRAGKPNDDLFRLVRRNVRMPDKVIGDLRAQIAANHFGIERMLALLTEAKLDRLSDLSDAIIKHTERSMRAAIATIPSGTYRHEVTLEETGKDGRPLKVCVSLAVSNEEIVADLSGTSDQVDLPINSVLNITQAYVLFSIKS